MLASGATTSAQDWLLTRMSVYVINKAIRYSNPRTNRRLLDMRTGIDPGLSPLALSPTEGVARRLLSLTQRLLHPI
ncbi:hypothetical protein J6590_060182 [Homalodisca vitripennis]|nr:hypothetical protein J6590_060182 [Homalodisca vitripennis]